MMTFQAAMRRVLAKDTSRGHRLRSHTKKVPFESQETADNAAVSMGENYPGHEFEGYKCQYCDWWHVGHKKGAPVGEIEKAIRQAYIEEETALRIVDGLEKTLRTAQLRLQGAQYDHNQAINRRIELEQKAMIDAVCDAQDKIDIDELEEYAARMQS